MNTEARTSIDTLLTTLKESLAQPGQSLLPLLTSMSRFAKYSLANQMLIFAQRPDATHVWATAPGTRPATRCARAKTASRSTRRCSSPASATPQRNPTPTPHPASATAWPTSSTSRRWTPSPAPTRRARTRTPPAPPTPTVPRAAEGLPRRPQRRARVQDARSRPARLHRRPPHHLRHRPGLTRRVRHPRP